MLQYIIALMEMFKTSEGSLLNHEVRVYVRCEPACGGVSYRLNNAMFKKQETAFCWSQVIFLLFGGVPFK